MTNIVAFKNLSGSVHMLCLQSQRWTTEARSTIPSRLLIVKHNNKDTSWHNRESWVNKSPELFWLQVCFTADTTGAVKKTQLIVQTSNLLNLQSQQSRDGKFDMTERGNILSQFSSIQFSIALHRLNIHFQSESNQSITVRYSVILICPNVVNTALMWRTITDCW